ncbi:MAG: L-fucose mutarotase [Eubacteriales bacterium]|nr:L-fucose mutarotase [Eubacteriales bacterium]
MLKGISPLISPELLKALDEMGHGDELVIADGNFPCESIGKNSVVIRADGHGTAEILDAVLSLIPLDTYTEKPVALMEVVKGDSCPQPVIWEKYEEILNKHEPDHHDIEMTERFAFYERAKGAYLIIATGETAVYANVLLKKGVVVN